MAKRRKSARIIVLPGIERRDLAGSPCSSRNVLQAAIDQGVTDVLIVGRDRKGQLYIAGAPPDVDKSVGMLMRAVAVLSDCHIINDVEIDTNPAG
jgi:hypothetical protein